MNGKVDVCNSIKKCLRFNDTTYKIYTFSHKNGNRFVFFFLKIVFLRNESVLPFLFFFNEILDKIYFYILTLCRLYVCFILPASGSMKKVLEKKLSDKIILKMDT